MRISWVGCNYTETSPKNVIKVSIYFVSSEICVRGFQFPAKMGATPSSARIKTAIKGEPILSRKKLCKTNSNTSGGRGESKANKTKKDDILGRTGSKEFTVKEKTMIRESR